MTACRDRGGARARIDARRRSQRSSSRMSASSTTTSGNCRRTTAIVDATGVELGTRWTPVASAGLYVPGGTASYPSSVLMNAVPAKVAGVQAHRHGRAGAKRARSIRWCWWRPSLAGVERDLSRRRRAGDRRARLWHREHRARRQDRRPRQRLCRRRQAPGLRPGRHRHGGGPVRGGGDRRQQTTIRPGSPPTCSPRPSTIRRRKSILITDDRSLRRRGRARRSRSQLAGCRARDQRARAGATFGAVILVERLDEAPSLADRLAPEHLEIATERA